MKTGEISNDLFIPHLLVRKETASMRTTTRCYHEPRFLKEQAILRGVQEGVSTLPLLRETLMKELIPLLVFLPVGFVFADSENRALDAVIAASGQLSEAYSPEHVADSIAEGQFLCQN